MTIHQILHAATFLLTRKLALQTKRCFYNSAVKCRRSSSSCCSSQRLRAARSCFQESLSGCAAAAADHATNTTADGLTARPASIADVTLRCLSRKKPARKEMITDFYKNFTGPIKSLPIIGSLPRKVSPGRQFTGKNLSRPGGRRAGRVFAGKLSARGRFSMGRSYNRTPAVGQSDHLNRRR